MQPMTPTRRLASTAAMFAITLIFLVIASTTHDVWPLFVGWIPLLAVPWLLTRPEANTAPAGARTSTAEPQEPIEGTASDGAAALATTMETDAED